MVVDAGELKISVEKPAAWARRLTITVPAERIARERRDAAERLARKVKLPGFRKGKVPAHVMEKRFGAAIEQETIEKVVGAAYREALQREGLEPITQGAVENLEYSGSDLTFNVDLEVRPQIEIARLGGFVVHRRVPAVAEAQIGEVLDRLRDEQAVWKPLSEEDTPVSGDRVDVDITPLSEAEGVEPGKPRRYQIVLGEDQAAPSIEEAVRTLRPGQENEFKVDLSPAGAEGATPEPHQLRITMLEAKRPERPPLDDEFVRGLGEFEGLDDLRARIRQDLEREAESEAERMLRGELIQNIVEANPFEVPASMVTDYLNRLIPDREGVDDARLAEVRESARPAAERALQRLLVIDRIAELESLRATHGEVEERIGNIAERIGRSPGEVRAQLKQSGRLHEIEEEITETKVFDYLKSLSTIA